MEFKIKVQKTLNDLVYQDLKRKILTGEIPSRTRLMEIELANKMNVSRTPIREAIRRLAEDGLVQVEPRRGAFVSNISIKDMLDVFETRADLEGFTAYLAAQRITEEQKVEMRKIIEAYDAAAAARDKDVIIALDENFHNFIVSCCDNDTLKTLIKFVQELALRFRYLYYDKYSLYLETAAAHRRIMEAITSGDAHQARIVAEEHIHDLKQFVIKLEDEI